MKHLVGAGILLSGLSVALSFGPAIAQDAVVQPAKTLAECKQEYAVKRAAGETSGQSRASFVKACLAPEKTTAADPAPKAPTDPHEHEDETSLAKKAENPIADLISVPFNNYATFNYGGSSGIPTF